MAVNQIIYAQFIWKRHPAVHLPPQIHPLFINPVPGYPHGNKGQVMREAWQTVAHRVETAEGWRWLRPGEDWADYVGFGLTKFTPDVPPDQTDWGAGSWQDLDSRVSDWTRDRGIRWHIHWPLAAHYHVLEG